MSNIRRSERIKRLNEMKVAMPPIVKQSVKKVARKDIQDLISIFDSITLSAPKQPEFTVDDLVDSFKTKAYIGEGKLKIGESKEVKGKTGTYTVSNTKEGYVCTCLAWKYSPFKFCKHCDMFF